MKSTPLLSIKKATLSAFLITLLTSATLFAKTTVASIAELQTAINKAQPGDVIVLKSGKYTTLEDIVINTQGTAQQPITITAEKIGETEITGKGGFTIISPARYIIIKGFKFTHLASKAKTGNGTSFCRFTQNIFETPGDGEDLTVSGTDQEIDYNTFQNKNAMGRFVAIRGEGKQIAERLHIHHNYFNTAASQGGKNGAEAFQFGLSGFSMSFSNSIVEYNVFEKCEGENELISVKVGGVTLRYNTIRDCPAQFTLRHGNKNLVYGNYFKNTPGLRIFGDDHQIFSNYFEDCKPAITIGNGGAEVADGAPLVSHDRPDRILIVFNTLINNKENIVQTPRKDGLGATYVTVANNIIEGGGAAAKISGPMAQAKWQGNIIYKVAGAGDLPAGSYQNIDPKLIKDTSGIFQLPTNSPLIKTTIGQYPAVKIANKAVVLSPSQVGYLAKK